MRIVAHINKAYAYLRVSGVGQVDGNGFDRQTEQIFGAIAECDKAMIVLKQRGGRQRIKARTGRCEGSKAFGTSARSPHDYRTHAEPQGVRNGHRYDCGELERGRLEI
jgi:hypothetical protein